MIVLSNEVTSPKVQPADHIEEDAEVDVQFCYADEPGCRKSMIT